MGGVLVVGAGSWGRKLTRNFAALGGLAGVCEVQPDLLEEAGREHPGVSLWSELDEALAEGGFEGVAVATPVTSHYPVAIRVLEAGFPLFLEKPMATASHESRALLELAARRGLPLMVGHLPLFLPAVEELKRALVAGELGELLYLQARRVNLGRIREHENVLWSLAPHDVAVFLHLLEDLPSEVQCFGQAWLRPGIEDVVFLELRFPGGRLAQAHFSWLDPGRERRLKVVGRGGMAVVDELSDRPLLLTDRRYEVEGAVHVQGEPRFPALSEERPLARECRHFLECLRSGTAPRSDARLGHHVVRILEAASRSLSEGGVWRVLEEEPLDLSIGPVPARG